MEFSGRLTAFPPGDLLQWAHSDGRTGVLVLRRASREKQVWFQAGEVVGCSSDDPAESLGQHLLLGGQLTEDQLNQALTHSAEAGCSLEAALVELGLLTAEQIRKIRRHHVRELVCDLFLWGRGVFYFETGRPPEGEGLPLPLSTLELALEGSRWADEHRRIRRVLVHDDVVLRRAPAVGAAELTPLQRWIVDKVDGERSLAELYRAVGGSHFRFLAAALELCVHEVLDIAEVPEEEPTGSHELSLAELALEEAQEASPGPEGHGLVPLSALADLVPVVVGEPPPGGLVSELCARCDGTRRLAEILGPDQETGLGLFLAALRDGALALLPAPVDELDAPGRLAGALGGGSS